MAIDGAARALARRGGRFLVHLSRRTLAAAIPEAAPALSDMLLRLRRPNEYRALDVDIAFVLDVGLDTPEEARDHGDLPLRHRPR